MRSRIAWVGAAILVATGACFAADFEGVTGATDYPEAQVDAPVVDRTGDIELTGRSDTMDQAIRHLNGYISTLQSRVYLTVHPAPVAEKGAGYDVPTDGYTFAVAGFASRPDATVEADRRCTGVRGASVTVLGDDPGFGTLVRYSSPAGPSGAKGCEDGTLAFVPWSTLRAWPAKGGLPARERETVEARRAALDRIVTR